MTITSIKNLNNHHSNNFAPTLDRQKTFPVFVAVVDDEIDITSLFRDALSHIANVQAFAFSDPNLALEHFRINHRNYRCIISDYRMASMNGIELLDKVKQISPGITRVLISAFEIQDEIFKTAQCIDKFLQKPVRIADLIELVQNCLDPSKIEESNRE
jgi:DNA-binding NtrC family response regulator